MPCPSGFGSPESNTVKTQWFENPSEISTMVRYSQKKPTPEGMVTCSIRDLLKTIGVFHWKEFQTLGSFPGVSDIVGIYKGRFLAIEVKAPKGKPSPAQVAFLDRIRQEGGIAILAYSIDDVIEGLGIQDRFLRFGG